MSAQTMLIVGYGLSIVLYGGYWIWLLRKSSKLTKAYTAETARIEEKESKAKPNGQESSQEDVTGRSGD